MKKENVVTVLTNREGEVVSVSQKNNTYGWVMVESIQPTFNEQGFMRLGKRVAFIAGTVSDLRAFNLSDGQELPGQIVIREQIEPLDATNPEAGMKYPNSAAKEAELVCVVDGEPVYRKVFYTPDMTKQDILVQHDNGDEIRAFMDRQKKIAASKANTPGIKNAGINLVGSKK